MNKNDFYYEMDDILNDLDNMYKLLKDNIIESTIDINNSIVLNEIDYIDKLIDEIKLFKNIEIKDYLKKLLVLQRCFYYLQINSNLYNSLIFNRIMFIIQMIYNNLKI